jgi:hypothetical protein
LLLAVALVVADGVYGYYASRGEVAPSAIRWGIALLVFLPLVGVAALIDRIRNTIREVRSTVRELDKTMTQVLGGVNRLRTALAQQAVEGEEKEAEAQAADLLEPEGQRPQTGVKKAEE